MHLSRLRCVYAPSRGRVCRVLALPGEEQEVENAEGQRGAPDRTPAQRGAGECLLGAQAGLHGEAHRRGFGARRQTGTAGGSQRDMFVA